MPFSQSHTEFDKNANSDSVIVEQFIFCRLVWRLSEVAFFVGLLR